MLTSTCEDCIFYSRAAGEGQLGECRRREPGPNGWPKVSIGAWCGEGRDLDGPLITAMNRDQWKLRCENCLHFTRVLGWTEDRGFCSCNPPEPGRGLPVTPATGRCGRFAGHIFLREYDDLEKSADGKILPTPDAPSVMHFFNPEEAALVAGEAVHD
jgi:hypothetical protein